MAPPLAVAMGKAHVMYLLDRTHLGHVQDGDAGALRDFVDELNVLASRARGAARLDGELLVRDLLRQPQRVVVLSLMRTRNADCDGIDTELNHSVQ